MTKTSNKNQQTNCPHCQVGVLRQKYLTYFTWLNSELITVPDFPSWVCDYCGDRHYDGKALNQLDNLLRPIGPAYKTEIPRSYQDPDSKPVNPQAGME